LVRPPRITPSKRLKPRKLHEGLPSIFSASGVTSMVPTKTFRKICLACARASAGTLPAGA